MEEDEDNVYMTSIHDHYAARPDDIENMCLAKFAIHYEPVTSQTDSLHDLDNNSDTESDSQHNNRNTRIKLKDGLDIMKKCSQEFILRVKNYKQNMEPEKFYHSRLLLYLPWQNDDELLGQYENYHAHYLEVLDLVEHIMQVNFT